MRNRIIVFSGPSTIGKNPLIYEICKNYDFKFIIPYTTRLARSSETNLIDYVFLDEFNFIQKIRSKNFSAWDYSLNNFYGFDKFSFTEQGYLATHCLSRMALRLRDLYPEIHLVFIMPMDENKIINRLSSIYAGDDLKLRLQHLKEEIVLSKMFDEIYSVDNALTLLKNKKFLSLLE